MKKLKTLERYFRDELEAGNIDHALRVSILSDGRVYFYIHPATSSGDTQDFTVKFNSLTTHEGQPSATLPQPASESNCKCGKAAGPSGFCDDCFLSLDGRQFDATERFGSCSSRQGRLVT